jgi:hypothetical protein
MGPPSARIVAGLLLIAALDARAEPTTGLLLRVRVINVAYTDYYRADDCPPEQDCIAGNTWFRYDAKVGELFAAATRSRRCNSPIFSTLTSALSRGIGSYWLSHAGRALSMHCTLSIAFAITRLRGIELVGNV